MAKKEIPQSFDPANPDKKMVRMILHQAFGSGQASGVVEIQARCWTFRDMEQNEWTN